LKQAEISAQQTQINQKVLDLEYNLSVDLDYDQQKKCFVLSNRSRRNVFYGGTRFGGTGPLEDALRQITPGGTMEIHRQQSYEEFVPTEGGFQEDVSLYLMDERNQKYVLTVNVSVQMREGKMSVIDVRKGAPTPATW